MCRAAPVHYERTCTSGTFAQVIGIENGSNDHLTCRCLTCYASRFFPAYEFKYHVDGDTWVNDPEADDYASNPYVEKNSVVHT